MTQGYAARGNRPPAAPPHPWQTITPSPVGIQAGRGDGTADDSRAMTTIVKAAGAAEFLSLVPRMLGYVPTRSLVMIPFDGSRSVGAMRFDLPGDEPDAVDRVAATVIGTVCRLPDADAVAAITFTDAAFGEENRMPHTGLLRALERRADACGLRLTDALCVAKDGWGSLLDAHCPAGGRLLADLDLAPATDVGADRDQGSGAELPEVDVAQSERVARALLSLDRAIEVLCGPEEPAAEASRPSGPQPRPTPMRTRATTSLPTTPTVSTPRHLRRCARSTTCRPCSRTPWAGRPTRSGHTTQRRSSGACRGRRCGISPSCSGAER
nr:hypothetical protein GCM10025699_06440 [Microbacterium flavescens]